MQSMYTTKVICQTIGYFIGYCKVNVYVIKSL